MTLTTKETQIKKKLQKGFIKDDVKTYREAKKEIDEMMKEVA